MHADNHTTRTITLPQELTAGSGIQVPGFFCFVAARAETNRDIIPVRPSPAILRDTLLPLLCRHDFTNSPSSTIHHCKLDGYSESLLRTSTSLDRIPFIV